MLKEAAEEELIQAVRLAAEGRTYLNPELGARLAAEAPGRQGRPTTSAPASSRCCGLIALGHTNGEIAAQLFLSVRTVESHRAHIQQKTQRSSRAELVAYAREHGLRLRRGRAGAAGAGDLVALWPASDADGGTGCDERTRRFARSAAATRGGVTVAVSWRAATLHLTSRGAVAQQRRPGLRADDPVGGQPVGGLEGLDRRQRVVAEVAVDA